MPNSEKEVFDFFTYDQDEGNILPYLCYAIFAAEKYEWINQYLENNGQYPSEDEEHRYISELTDNYFNRIQKRAINWIDEFSFDYLKDIIEEKEKTAVKNSIYADISYLNRFWPVFWNNVAGGVVAAIIFAIIVFAIAFMVFGNISPVYIAREVSNY